MPVLRAAVPWVLPPRSTTGWRTVHSRKNQLAGAAPINTQATFGCLQDSVNSNKSLKTAPNRRAKSASEKLRFGRPSDERVPWCFVIKVTRCERPRSNSRNPMNSTSRRSQSSGSDDRRRDVSKCPDPVRTEFRPRSPWPLDLVARKACRPTIGGGRYRDR